ncbi:DNA-binding response regulator [Paenibacillus peoriae]|nr:response regulator transcription factor [Paenibacillus peoriae]OMF70307.1 DNA-binding response regulator [Paenibacillus peoriae]OMF81233.1 DNA-binding response regulator [Paenibacillus peoriae]
MDKSLILLVDDQPLVRQGMKYIIGAQPDMQVVGEAGDGIEAIELALKTNPDLILMDVQMPQCNGIKATREILLQKPDCKIVILTTFDTEEYVFEGIRAGSIGYLLKDTEPEELLAAIRSALRGEVIFRTALAAKLIGEALQKNSPSTPSMEGHQSLNKEANLLIEAFTNRELEVLQLMAYGLRNEEIADKLILGESTVKTHVHRILKKFDVQDRTQAVVYAIRNSIVD